MTDKLQRLKELRTELDKPGAPGELTQAEWMDLVEFGIAAYYALPLLIEVAEEYKEVIDYLGMSSTALDALEREL